MKLKPILLSILFLLLISYSYGEDKEDQTLKLQLGNSQHKHQLLTILPVNIYSAETGKTISYDRMIKEMADCCMIYVGESHNSLPMHQIQARIIRSLFELDRNLSIGMEMFTGDLQSYLNKWSLGILTEKEFIQEARWYENWNFNFGYYREIMDISREYKTPIYALNAPRELISTIRMRGWKALSPEEKKLIPEPDLTHTEHKQLIKAIFENMDMPPQMKGAGLEMVFNGLYRAQAAWDEVMAANTIKAVQADGRRIVILAGSGHMLYNLGINRRVYEKTRLPFKTVVCIPVEKTEGSVEVSRSLADYIWGINAEEHPAYPAVGLKLKKIKGLRNLVVERKPIDGAAKEAGFEKGDVVLFVNDRPFMDINQLHWYTAGFSWEDEIKYTVLRAGKEIDISVKLIPSGQGKKEN